MKKNLIVLFVLIILVVLFSVTQGRPTTDEPGSQAVRKVTVLLDWFPNTNHTGLYVAQEKGYYMDEGIEVEIIQPGEGDSGQIIASGTADYGISAQESVTLARAKDIPLVSIAAVMQHNTSAFASLKSAGITEVADFEGKRYGGWGSPIEEATLKALMDGVGADYSTVENITIGTTDFFSTIGEESDFQWIFYGWDGVEAERRGIDLDLIWLKDLDPVLDYYTPVIITNEEHVSGEQDLTERFMRATAAGYEYAAQNPQEAADILIKAAPELDEGLVQASQEWVSEQYIADSDTWGVQREEVWERYATWLHERDLIEKMIDPQSAFTNQFLP